MEKHKFLFTPGTWLGEGKIQLNMMSEELKFFTRWKIPELAQGGRLLCSQEIQVSGMSDTMINEFSLSEIKPGTFTIELENQSLGKVIGGGKVNSEVIAWEFRLNSLGFEGFEVYEKKTESEYDMHAEYATKDDFRTVIHGKIWKQESPPLIQEQGDAT